MSFSHPNICSCTFLCGVNTTKSLSLRRNWFYGDKGTSAQVLLALETHSVSWNYPNNKLDRRNREQSAVSGRKLDTRGFRKFARVLDEISACESIRGRLSYAQLWRDIGSKGFSRHSLIGREPFEKFLHASANACLLRASDLSRLFLSPKSVKNQKETRQSLSRSRGCLFIVLLPAQSDRNDCELRTERKEKKFPR